MNVSVFSTVYQWTCTVTNLEGFVQIPPVLALRKTCQHFSRLFTQNWCVMFWLADTAWVMGSHLELGISSTQRLGVFWLADDVWVMCSLESCSLVTLNWPLAPQNSWVFSHWLTLLGWFLIGWCSLCDGHSGIKRSSHLELGISTTDQLGMFWLVHAAWVFSDWVMDSLESCSLVTLNWTLVLHNGQVCSDWLMLLGWWTVWNPVV